jgi:hypothetical protein
MTAKGSIAPNTTRAAWAYPGTSVESMQALAKANDKPPVM